MLVIPIRQPAERNLISNNLQVLILPDTTDSKTTTDKDFPKISNFHLEPLALQPI